MLGPVGGYVKFLGLFCRLPAQSGLYITVKHIHSSAMTVEHPGACQAQVEGPPYRTPAALEKHIERSWAYFRSLGSPKFHVAPMVDQVRGV